MTGGSTQLRRFRIAIRDGMELGAAADLAGIGLIEAKLTVAHDHQFPPPPEAFQLIASPVSGQPKEAAMARAEKKEAVDGEYIRPDAEAAFKIYDKEIAPKLTIIQTKRGDLSEPYGRIKDNHHFPRNVLNFILTLEGQEDAKRDHMLLALADGLKVRKLFMPRDLVSIAAGNAGADIVAFGERSRPGLVTVPHDGDNSDLADAADPDDFTETTPEELAQQEGRPAADTAEPDDATEEGLDD